MSGDAHRSIDVDVFKEILENEFFTGDRNRNEIPELLDLVKKTNTIEKRIPGIDLDIKKELAKIKFKQYGFKNKADFAYEYKQDVFENETIILLVPQKVYELEDTVKSLPVPYCEKGKKLLMLLSDTYERLKIKAKNILQNTTSDDQITHYAKKNIQIALRNCYDARMLLVKIQKTKNRDAIFLVFMANVFMINVVAYLTKMFNSYYSDVKNDKGRQKAELYDVMDLNVIMEPEVEYKKKKAQEKAVEFDMPQIRLKVQTNQFLTLVYDILNFKTEEITQLLEIDQKELEEILSKVVYDKKGNLLKKSTINTCLKQSREDKRVSGSKRIDVLKCFDPEKH
ncbi:MAG: hypothetical protein PHE33_04380 [Bacteroidales bacterium]|nr:hypothetical protein [Bacteroidales bacterium]